MEVNGISQGRQTTFENGKSIDKVVQVKDRSYLQEVKTSDNKNIGTKEISNKELKNAVDKLNKFLEDNQTHAVYEYHDKLRMI
jgi:flagellar protein FlaG